jgi:hypothetical protein
MEPDSCWKWQPQRKSLSARRREDRQTHSRPCPRRFPPAKVHTRTTSSPRIVHIFRARKKHDSYSSPPKIPKKNLTQPSRKPKLTTTHHKNRTNVLSTRKWSVLRYLHLYLPEIPFIDHVFLIDEVLANPPASAQGPRSTIPLMRAPELSPGHLRRPAHKDIRMILTLLVLYPFRVPVMPRPSARSKRPLRLHLRKSNHYQC